MMDREADSDIPFSWHALAVDKPKTFKKKGDVPKADTYPAADKGGSRSGYLDSGAGNSLPSQGLQDLEAGVGNNIN